jgi:hypothetical protein
MSEKLDLVKAGRIYNNHLAISRKLKDKPFKLRKDFSKLTDEQIMVLGKILKMFTDYPNIDQEAFFSAPFKIYPDEDHYPLEFFTTQKAKRIYAQYMKTLEDENPDTKESLERLRDGLKFVKNFCDEKGLTFEEYSSYSEHNLPCIVDHLKSHKINFYVLHSLGITTLNIETRILDFIFGDFYLTFRKTKNKFYTSERMKKFSKLAINKLKNTIN